MGKHVDRSDKALTFASSNIKTLVDLVDTTFPSGRNDALQWNIESRMDGKLPVEIRYFTSGITWNADYVGIANQDETKLKLTGYVRVINNSGELYDNAQTRLVVGTINLVEKIADLATRPAPGGEGLVAESGPGPRRHVTVPPFDKSASRILEKAINCGNPPWTAPDGRLEAKRPKAESSSRASANTSSSRSKAAKTSKTTSRNGSWR